MLSYDHRLACSDCGAQVQQGCLIGGVRLSTIIHTARARQNEFARALDAARQDI